MLVHLGKADVAEKINNAWLATLESGIHTADIYTPQHSTRKVGTNEFADEIIARMGQRPSQLTPVQYRAGGIQVKVSETKQRDKQLVGVDVFLDWAEDGRDPQQQLASPMAVEDDYQPRGKSLSGRAAGNLLYRPLAVPVYPCWRGD